MKARKAVYAASLDPITNGHINVIERMATIYDELVVLVAVDPKKTYTFSAKERVDMAKAAVAHISNISVDACIGRYVVKHADSIGARVIIRGLRNFKDLEDELVLAEENRRICPGIETVWVPCLPDLMHVSSSMVKSHVGIDPGWEEQVARSVPAAVVTKLKEKFILAKAHRHWASLMSTLGNLPGSGEVFEGLLASYSEPGRAYHTLEHIVMMLDELETAGIAIEDKPALLLAIWYHDAIYEPSTKEHRAIADNEARSAYRARSDMESLGLPETRIARVESLVKATTHTELVSDPDAKILVDLDLAILGKPEKEFDAYEIGIRKEYSHVPWPDFCVGRAKILRSFLGRGSIYSTEYFQKRYESSARENLGRALRLLH